MPSADDNDTRLRFGRRSSGSSSPDEKDGGRGSVPMTSSSDTSSGVRARCGEDGGDESLVSLTIWLRDERGRPTEANGVENARGCDVDVRDGACRGVAKRGGSCVGAGSACPACRLGRRKRDGAGV